MKLNRRQLRKLIINEIRSTRSEKHQINEVAFLIPHAILLAAGLAASTADAEAVWNKLDPAVQNEINNVYNDLRRMLHYLEDDAVNDIIATAVTKIVDSFAGERIAGDDDEDQ